MNSIDNTIIALATPPGISALAVIRLSGKNAIEITQRVFKGKNLLQQPTHTVHLGGLGEKGRTIDEVMVAIFKEPHSFTKENSVEISCHGSPVIVKEIIKLLMTHGARLAKPGEFTQRAFFNGRFDLAQAEAVADLIHAENDNARQAALNQMRGMYIEQCCKSNYH